MAKADLHIHSKYSDHPSEWFLQRLGARESYTDPEYIYKTMKEQGMDFITLTDHNEIEGSMILKAKYPDKVFTGVESTVYFPEDDCKIHLLIYDITESEFKEIQILRTDIYQLRDFIKEKNLAHSVAHATFAINNKLNIDHLEKLILLFDVFETINGARNVVSNITWHDSLSNLTPDHIDNLYKKYQILPFSDKPWIKGFTGGSDDHAALFQGQTYTLANAITPKEFINQIKEKQTYPGGRHNNFQTLAFSIYKVAYDFSKNKNEKSSKSFLSNLTQYIFEKKGLGLKDTIQFRILKSSPKNNSHQIYR